MTEIPSTQDFTKWKWGEIKNIILHYFHLDEKLREASNFKFLKRIFKFYKINDGEFVKK